MYLYLKRARCYSGTRRPAQTLDPREEPHRLGYVPSADFANLKLDLDIYIYINIYIRTHRDV